jgi:proteasome lid subunit RPN8/RPN11
VGLEGIVKSDDLHASGIEWTPLTDTEPLPLASEHLLLHRRVEANLRQGNVAVGFVPAARHQISTHLNADMGREHGGILFGMPYRTEHGGYVVIVTRGVGGELTEGSPVHLRFTERTWDRILIQIPCGGERLVGWYHSHPGLGVFMSGTDRQTHARHFQQPWQVALVVDPRSGVWGVFGGEKSRPVQWFEVDEVSTHTRQHPLSDPALGLSEAVAANRDDGVTGVQVSAGGNPNLAVNVAETEGHAEPGPERVDDSRDGDVTPAVSCESHPKGKEAGECDGGDNAAIERMTE